MTDRKTRFDPSTGILTVQRSNSGLHPFLRAGSVDDDLGGNAKLTKPYAHSAWVSSAVKTVARPIVATDLKFSIDRRGGDQLLDDQETNAFWENPASHCGKPIALGKLIFASVGWKLLKGEIFWILDDTWLERRAIKKSPVILARPDRMREILDSDRQLIGWEYRDGSGKRHVLIPEQVVTDMEWNPYNDHRGLASWEAAKVAADSDYAAAVFGRNLSENNGDRGPIVVAKGGMPSNEQREQITAALRNKQRLARQGKFKAVFLAGDIAVEDPKLQAVDSAFISQRVENRHEIYAAFGVPMSMAEVTASYSIGSASDRFRLIEDTCQPVACDLADMIQMVENIRRNGIGASIEVYAELSFSNHSTMVEVRSERMESASKMHDRGVPWRVASDYFGLDLPQFPGDNVAWQDFGKVPYEDGNVSDANSETHEQEDGSKALTELETLFRSCGAHGRNARCSDDAPIVRVPEKQALFDAQIKARAATAKTFRNRFNRALMAARKETLDNLAMLEEASKRSPDDMIRSGGVNLTFTLEVFKDSLLKLMGSTHEETFEKAGKGLFEEIGEAVSAWIKPDQKVLDFLRIRKNFIGDASDKVWQAIVDTLDEGITNGESIAKLTDRVRAEFNNISRTRATMIAVTETTAVYETARIESMGQAGIEWKQWLSSQDERVRLSHYAADGQKRELDAPFEVNGKQLMHPGDPNGGPAEVVNCRCMSIALDGPDDDDGGEPIPIDDEDIPY